MALERLTLTDPRLPALLEGRPVPFFCSPIWNEVLEQGLGARAAYYAVAEGGVYRAALAGVHLKFGPVRMFYANIPYGGLIGDASAFPLLASELDAQLRGEGVHEVRIVRTAFDAFDPPAGYECTEAVHHLLDLGALDFTSPRPYPSNVMRNVRKALDDGVEVRDIEAPDQVDRLYDLYVDTMRRKTAPTTWTRRFLRALYERLVVPGQARMPLAWHEGRIVAGVVLIRSGEIVYYFFGASDAEALAHRPNDLLFSEAIRRSAADGCRTFDFMTSRSADEGLIRFKEKWGGRPKPLRIYRTELSRMHARLWRWTQRAAGSRLGAALVRWLQNRR
jgi:hypothetical protein